MRSYLVVNNASQGSKEWLELRKHILISGSTVSKVLNKNKYRTDYLELVKSKATKTYSQFQAPAMAFGVKYEPLAREHYSKLLGVKVSEPGLIINKNYPRFGFSPDGIFKLKGQLCLLEIKCVYTREMNGTIPGDYMHQMQLGMFLTEIKECHYVEYKFDKETGEYQRHEAHIVKADPEWYNKYIPDFDQFEEDVKNYKPSPQTEEICLLDNLLAATT